MRIGDLHVRRCWCTDRIPDDRCLTLSTDTSYLWFNEAKKAHKEAQILRESLDYGNQLVFESGKQLGEAHRELAKLRRVHFLAEQWRLQRYEKNAPGAGERAFILRLADAEEDLLDELLMIRDHPHE